MCRRWLQTLAEAGKRWNDVDGDQHAAAFAYYFLLSVFPLVTLLVTTGSWMLPREVVTRELVDFLGRYLPLTQTQEQEAAAMVHQVLNARGQINVVAFGLLVWGSLKFLAALIRSTNRIWQAPGYGWWQLPMHGLRLLAITASVVLIGMVLPAVARIVRKWVATYAAFPDWAFNLVFELLPWLVFFGGILMIYKWAPSCRVRFGEIWVFALGTTVLIWFGEVLFMFYAAHFGRFSALYGALGGIIAFLLWVHLSSTIWLFGVCLCAAHANRKRQLAIDDC